MLINVSTHRCMAFRHWIPSWQPKLNSRRKRHYTVVHCTLQRRCTATTLSKFLKNCSGANTRCSPLQLFAVLLALFNPTFNNQCKDDKKFLNNFVNKKFVLESLACGTAKNKFENDMQLSFASYYFTCLFLYYVKLQNFQNYVFIPNRPLQLQFTTSYSLCTP